MCSFSEATECPELWDALRCGDWGGWKPQTLSEGLELMPKLRGLAIDTFIGSGRWPQSFGGCSAFALSAKALETVACIENVAVRQFVSSFDLLDMLQKLSGCSALTRLELCSRGRAADAIECTKAYVAPSLC